jgi:hypothetical protein
MKKYIILFLLLMSTMICFNSCIEKYLDKAPQAGLTDDQIYSSYDNFYKFFNGMFDIRRGYGIQQGFPVVWNTQESTKCTWTTFTEMADAGRIMGVHSIKSGVGSGMGSLWSSAGTDLGIFPALLRVIRISNLVLENIDKLKNVNQQDIDDMIAQAYFCRAFCHFVLCKFHGGMPYVTKALGADDIWDMERLSNNDCYLRIAADLDTAVIFFEKAGKMRRDPGPGQIGHLNNPDQWRPTGVAAKALKGRILLYAASPLSNKNGVSDWQNAAKANWDAIQVALQYQYALQTAAKYTDNFTNVPYTNEQLWGQNIGVYAWNNGYRAAMVSPVFTQVGNFSGECPTQNCVDKFETRWGEPLTTQAERDAATALGHYNEQDPYSNRDPRLAINVVYNQAPIPGTYPGGVAPIYYEMIGGVAQYSELLSRSWNYTRTGYYNNKYWGGNSVRNKVDVQITDPVIRLAELYLNYAEAANEAYGPNTPAPGAALTAVQAVNLIRTRIGMPNVLSAYTASTTVFRPRIKNERTIELCLEDAHYYHDIRRWMDAPVTMAGPLFGISVEKVTVSPTYPTGYKYSRVPLEDARQSHWIGDPQYYIPFPISEMYKMKNFVPNVVW